MSTTKCDLRLRRDARTTWVECVYHDVILAMTTDADVELADALTPVQDHIGRPDPVEVFDDAAVAYKRLRDGTWVRE